jgi:hypothetical protein
MSPTQTIQQTEVKQILNTNSFTNKIKTIDFCDNHKIPYILCFIRVVDDEKKIEGLKDTKGWTDWSYEKCMEHNKSLKRKMNAMNINIRKSNFMVIDIDEPNTLKYCLDTFSNEWVSYSTRKKLPHLWRVKDENDISPDVTNVYDKHYDLKFSNIFERIDNFIHYNNEDMPEWFSADHPTPKLKTDEPRTSSITYNNEKNDTELNEDETNRRLQHLQNINNEYIEEYHHWFKICMAIKSQFPKNYFSIIKCWSEMSKRPHHNPRYVDYSKWENMFIGEAICGLSTILEYSEKSNIEIYDKIEFNYKNKIKTELTELGKKMLFDVISTSNMDIEPITFKDYIYNKIRKQGIIMVNDETRFQELIYDTMKGQLYLINNTIYLYYKNEWTTMKKNDPSMLKHIIIIIIKIYIDLSLDFFNQRLKDNQNDTVAFKKIEDDMKLFLKIILQLKSETFNRKISTLLINRLSCTKNDIVFDKGEQDYYNIQFKNGVYDLNKQLFRKRTKTDYITKYLNYDYIDENKIDDKIKNDVFDFFKKIQPDEAQRKFTLGYLYYCITGNTDKQIFKMNIGYTASNGKSTEIAIHKKCFDIYTRKLDCRVFELGFEKKHKFLVDCLQEPIRLAYIEELSKKKLDEKFIKDWVDGRGQSIEEMYGTKIDSDIQAKILTCSNYDPKIDDDEGMKRRGLIQRYESKFVKDEELVNESEHHYLRVDGFEKIFDDVKYKNAYFHLLLKYKELVIPSINEEEFKLTIENNDILDEIKENIEFTDCDDDKITYKIDIIERFGNEKAKIIKEKLQSIGNKYYKDLQKNTIKGIFKKMKMKVIEKKQLINVEE